MDPSLVALRALETIRHLKEELAKAHHRIGELEQQVGQKEQCILELTDSLMLRVIKARTQKGAGG
jgi:hypothetical protein